MFTSLVCSFYIILIISTIASGEWSELHDPSRCAINFFSLVAVKGKNDNETKSVIFYCPLDSAKCDLFLNRYYFLCFSNLHPPYRYRGSAFFRALSLAAQKIAFPIHLF